MRARAWWVVAAMGLTGCGGMPEQEELTCDDVLGRLRQNEETDGGSWVKCPLAGGEADAGEQGGVSGGPLDADGGTASPVGGPEGLIPEPGG